MVSSNPSDDYDLLDDLESEKRRPPWVVIVIVLVGVSLMALTIWRTTIISGKEDDLAVAEGQVRTLAVQVRATCDAGGAAARDLGNLCRSADQLLAAPAPVDIPGVPGPPGRDGVPGRNGADGAPGLPGRDGAPGKDGVDGVPGIDGMPGRDGIDGAPGVNGAPGRDGTPGPTCEPGEDRVRVTYADGRTGTGCVLPDPTTSLPPLPTE